MDTIDQYRARHIRSFLADPKKQLTAQHQSRVDAFASSADALPAQIVINGFGMAVATFIAQHRADTPERLVVDMLADWLIAHADQNGCPYSGEASTASALLGNIIDGSSDSYVLAQGEALAYLSWLKVLVRPLKKKKTKSGTSIDEGAIR